MNINLDNKIERKIHTFSCVSCGLLQGDSVYMMDYEMCNK